MVMLDEPFQRLLIVLELPVSEAVKTLGNLLPCRHRSEDRCE